MSFSITKDKEIDRLLNEITTTFNYTTPNGKTVVQRIKSCIALIFEQDCASQQVVSWAKNKLGTAIEKNKWDWIAKEYLNDKLDIIRLEVGGKTLEGDTITEKTESCISLICALYGNIDLKSAESALSKERLEKSAKRLKDFIKTYGIEVNIDYDDFEPF